MIDIVQISIGFVLGLVTMYQILKYDLREIQSLRDAVSTLEANKGSFDERSAHENQGLSRPEPDRDRSNESGKGAG